MSTTTTTKGALVAAAIEEFPAFTRAQIAALVGCTVGRVGEVVRGGNTVTTPQRTKGQLVADIIVSYPAATRAEIATMAMCTVGRVGEVIRAMA